MRFTETRVYGAFVIDIEPREDARGSFARAFCQREFEAAGLVSRIAQVNWSVNRLKGTVRGMHYQAAPHAEAKVVCCARGGLYDVVVDLRPGSATRGHWAAAELTAANRRMMYVPAGCGHGFQTLADDTEVLYLISEFYSPAHARGVRPDDPALGIEWPLPVACVSDADRTWPDYDGR
jgi:dTDP-4-dehydrorhamnose 3,5-epimerase